MQIMLVAPDEELQKRCSTVELELQPARGSAAVGGVPTKQPSTTHYNSTDQARRLAAYKQLRDQDDIDLEYLVRPFLHQATRAAGRGCAQSGLGCSPACLILRVHD